MSPAALISTTSISPSSSRPHLHTKVREGRPCNYWTCTYPPPSVWIQSPGYLSLDNASLNLSCLRPLLHAPQSISKLYPYPVTALSHLPLAALSEFSMVLFFSLLASGSSQLIASSQMLSKMFGICWSFPNYYFDIHCHHTLLGIIHMSFFLVPLMLLFVLVLTAQPAKFPSPLLPCFMVSSANVITWVSFNCQLDPT